MTPDPADPDRCSAKGCQAPATWQLLWNNPKLHTPERRKIWLACDEHRVSLADFLTARQFLKDVQPHPSDPELASTTDR
ncbi:MAG: acetone carboxylase [Nocardioides sp.]|nr:acetone carboxylase [Nocardioides sp.]